MSGYTIIRTPPPPLFITRSFIWQSTGVLLVYNIKYIFRSRLFTDVVKDVIRKRRAQKEKEDHILLDSLMDADFIDEEEVDMYLDTLCNLHYCIIIYYSSCFLAGSIRRLHF